MKKNEILITVGIPTYNAQPFIRRCIESILSQSLEELELLISDDGSSDQTLEICQDYAAHDDRIKIYTHEERLGEHRNKNFLVNKAKSIYFKALDQDDYLEGKKFLENHCIRLDEGYDFVISNVLIEETNKVEGTVQKTEGSMDCFFNCKNKYDFAKATLEESAMLVYGVFKTERYKKVSDRFISATTGKKHFIDSYFVHDVSISLKGYYLSTERFVYSIHGANISRSSPPKEFFPDFLFYINITLKLFIKTNKLTSLQKISLIMNFIFKKRIYAIFYYFYFSYIRGFIRTN